MCFSLLKDPISFPGSRARSMATEKCKAKTSDTSFTMQDVSIQLSSSVKRFENCHFEKALAYRAVYGGSGSRGSTECSGSIKARGNRAKISPSRLSKVSVATDYADN
ncbi:unnamed protein product [Lupinus luteus]|uniref:Uncharacterized protein n=1 Tax=Lupinus luteus TaxID=3873 RepID=A0AAV1VTP7_LUPLU